MSWQAVGAPASFSVDAKDVDAEEWHSFQFNGDEGNILIYYKLFTRTLPGEQVRVRVQFTELQVIDDEEIGSGDWRIVTSLNNVNCANSPEERWSIGTGSSADLSSFRSATVPVNSKVIVRCRAWEEDS
ncbi:hypothetical protein [Rhodococcus sp. NCIMB 12038]|uniref:hypothetical protein n=1 Tax=Rhodococcus sp. NCIMB 12038 TaxID=933800 RepID=UPI00117A3BB1|nr:hypothetical protein [Rhodococcus sp. NCIMB 12038]